MKNVVMIFETSIGKVLLLMFEMLIFKKHVKRCNSKRAPPGLRCLGIANKTLNGRDIFS